MTKKKNELIKSLSQHKNDVGSTEVQIGILNDKINNLTLHFKKFKSDMSSSMSFSSRNEGNGGLN